MGPSELLKLAVSQGVLDGLEFVNMVIHWRHNGELDKRPQNIQLAGADVLYRDDISESISHENSVGWGFGYGRRRDFSSDTRVVRGRQW